jgi:hypothetical protein
VDDPDFVRELNSVNDAKRVATKCQRDLEYAGTEAVQQLRDICLAALGRDCERG